ncbi:MAG: hypothetical protein ACRYFS_19035 [Janthinobacterium lividum]
MASNHKLTTLIKGRTIAGTSNQGGVLTISFTDHSKITVQTAGSSNSASTGGVIKSARQQGTTLSLDMVDGGTLEIQTAEETSSVMVRDGSGTMEYAD